jgi:Single-strand binding protein family
MRQRRALALCALQFFLCISLSVAWSAGFSNRIAFRQLKYATQTQATVSEEDAAAGYGYEDDNEEELSDEDLAASMGEWDEKIARFNTVHLTGRIGATPEAKYFDDGKVVVNVNLATKRKYNVNERKAFDIKSGDEATDWYGLEIWVRHSWIPLHVAQLSFQTS